MTEAQKATDAQIIADARWFPEALDAANRAVQFVRTDRATLVSRPFLSQSLWADATLPRARAGLESLSRQITARPHIHFLWHTAYCCSTLISQALDAEGRNLSIREPDALTVLARMKRGAMGEKGSYSPRHLAALLALLARPFATGEQVTLKPANAANNLIRDSAAVSDGRMIFLYSDCRSFVVSVARHGEARRGFVRRLFGELLQDGHEQASWSPPRLFELSDLQIAALVWHMQIAEFRRSAAAVGDRAASIDCDAFLDSPASVIARLSEFLSLGLDGKETDKTLAGPLLRRDAKGDGESLDTAERRRRQHDLPAQLARDIEGVVAWSYDVCKATPRGVPLPNPIVPGVGVSAS
jgi:hypothetical protein